MNRAVLLCLCAFGCSSASKHEVWEMLMGERGFVVEHLVFEPSGALHAIERVTGRTLDRDETWGGWTPSPGFVASHPPRSTAAFRSWDQAGNVYVSANVIYRSKRGTDEWQKIPGSEGKNLVTVDPAGNVYSSDARVLLAGTTEWKPSSVIDRVDGKGRPYSGLQRLEGTTLVTEQKVLSPTARFDANGDVLEASLANGTLVVTRHAFGATDTTELVNVVTSRVALAFIGCGTTGVCIFVDQDTDVLEGKGATLRQIGSRSVTSTGEALNLLGSSMTVSPTGRAIAFDVSGQGLSFSRAFQLIPGTEPWPGEVP